ncbi:hypothetical protein B0H12DRAFT_1283023 [Mycena haematopus]|nr:hypothetical protein B0H12DRAFT_1283023 [Mycena haematopus]
MSTALLSSESTHLSGIRASRIERESIREFVMSGRYSTLNAFQISVEGMHGTQERTIEPQQHGRLPAAHRVILREHTTSEEIEGKGGTNEWWMWGRRKKGDRTLNDLAQIRRFQFCKTVVYALKGDFFLMIVPTEMHSRTSGSVLQTALCYLEAIRPKVPELIRKKQFGDGAPSEHDSESRVTPATAAELELEAQLSSLELSAASAAHNEDVMDNVRVYDNEDLASTATRSLERWGEDHPCLPDPFNSESQLLTDIHRVLVWRPDYPDVHIPGHFNAGGEVTKNNNNLVGNGLIAEQLALQQVCLRNLFTVGRFDSRDSVECIFSTYLLLIFSIIMVSVYTVIFVKSSIFKVTTSNNK